MRKSFLIFVLAALLLASAVALFAQISPGITDEDRAEFARHRAALFAQLGDETAIFFGAYRSFGGRFQQDSNFWYLTGVEIPMAALILDGRKDTAVLFLAPERIGRDAIYNGPTIGPGPGAVATFGIADVRPIDQLQAALKELVPEKAAICTALRPEYPPFGPIASLPWSATPSQNKLVQDWLQQVLPGHEIKDISADINDLRRVKTPWEIARMEEAMRIAGEAHVAAMKATHPGISEAEIEGICAAVFLKDGAMAYGYSAIVGAGPNSCILHYPDSAGVAHDGELILMDFGPDYRYYIADITRTWPVNGKFTPEQRKAYLDVLTIQNKLIELVKPGVSIDDVYALHKKLSEEMGYGDNYIHGPSHYLGIDVHDVGDNSKPVVPGVIITIEPGVYFPDKGWGIRIEDDIVVTENGCRVLSADIPRTPDEIEAVMKK
jgi:Xaa-Pro aminopeptidase